MKKLSKEIGFSVLLSLTGANSSMIKEVISTLSSSAYDRNLEQEADLKSALEHATAAVRLIVSGKIDEAMNKYNS